jgi:alpha-1,6-mannosyltransferase
VLYAGRLSREKGLFDLLEAASRARQPWPLRVVGSGPARPAMQSAAERLGIADRVSWSEFVTETRALAREYAQAACVVMPGRYETFGLVALEAAAAGASVVTCDSAPSAAIAARPEHTFGPGDTAGMLRAIERARRAPVDMVSAARVAARYTWPAAFAAELRDLEELVR